MRNPQKPIRQSGFEADFAYGPPDAFHAAGQGPPAGRLYVDRFGREREETYVMDGSERELVSIDIWDCVAGTYYSLFPGDKSIVLEDSIESQEGRGGLVVSLPGVTALSVPRHFLSWGKIIGTRQINGLMCKGALREVASTNSRPGFAVECWYAEQIAYAMLVSAAWALSDGGRAETTFRLSKVLLRDMEPDLFQVTADYKPAKLVPVKK